MHSNSFTHDIIDWLLGVGAEHHFVVSSKFVSFSQKPMMRLNEYTLRVFAKPQEAFAPEHNA
jgi:hypothetical protein